MIVPWKFAKGKPRNALKPMLNSNSEEAVRTATRRAFDVADNITALAADDDEVCAAINEMCVLRGVGPATASAVLNVYRPEAFVFMDDEVIECLYEGKRGYTLKVYNVVNSRCSEIARELNGSGASKWTPGRVGMALWAVAAMSATGDDGALARVFREADDASKKRKGASANKGSRKRR